MKKLLFLFFLCFFGILYPLPRNYSFSKVNSKNKLFNISTPNKVPHFQKSENNVLPIKSVDKSSKKVYSGKQPYRGRKNPFQLQQQRNTIGALRTQIQKNEEDLKTMNNDSGDWATGFITGACLLGFGALVGAAFIFDNTIGILLKR